MAYNPRSGVGGNNGRVFYLTPSVVSDIAGYKLAGVSPSSAAEQTIVVNNTGTGDTLMATFCTLLGQPAVKFLPSGTTYRNIFVKSDGASSIARLKLELYQRNMGGVETLLRSNYSANFSGVDARLLLWQFSDASGHVFLPDDRIVFRIYCARVSGGSGSVVTTTYFEGVDRASHIITTVDLYTGS